MVAATARTLVLSDRLEPVGVVSWERAIGLWFADKQKRLNRVRVVAQYRKAKIRISVTEDNGQIQQSWFNISRPAVVRILDLSLRKRNPVLGFSRRHLYLRDQKQCQYCAVGLRFDEMTIDHVLPRASGGTTCWTNVVAACFDCNQEKADSLLEEIPMSLIQEPYVPRLNDLKLSEIKPSAFNKSTAHQLWRPYL